MTALTPRSIVARSALLIAVALSIIGMHALASCAGSGMAGMGHAVTSQSVDDMAGMVTSKGQQTELAAATGESPGGSHVVVTPANDSDMDMSLAGWCFAGLALGLGTIWAMRRAPLRRTCRLHLPKWCSCACVLKPVFVLASLPQRSILRC